MNILINSLLYLLTCISAMGFYKKEVLTMFIHAIIFIILIYLHLYRVYSIYTSIFIGLSLSIVSYVCVKYFHMWKHNSSKYSIPLWMPFTWSIVTFFIIDTSIHIFNYNLLK